MILRSPAKINLFLQILNKREDGYHNLSSLFQAVDLCDELSFEFSSLDQFTCSDSRLPCDANNLVIKARDLFRRKTGFSLPLTIHLKKNIPHQAGLGGGSGNAATTLWALNVLSGIGESNETLMQWAAEIGSDIPFFFSTGTAYCEGRGEIVRSLSPISLPTITLIKPPYGLATKDVYQRFKPNLDIRLVGPELRDCFNDLEKPAFEIEPKLKEIKEAMLKSGYEKVLLCGSGSALFGIGDHFFEWPECQCWQVKPIQRCVDGWF